MRWKYNCCEQSSLCMLPSPHTLSPRTASFLLSETHGVDKHYWLFYRFDNRIHFIVMKYNCKVEVQILSKYITRRLQSTWKPKQEFSRPKKHLIQRKHCFVVYESGNEQEIADRAGYTGGGTNRTTARGGRFWDIEFWDTGRTFTLVPTELTSSHLLHLLNQHN